MDAFTRNKTPKSKAGKHLASRTGRSVLTDFKISKTDRKERKPRQTFTAEILEAMQCQRWLTKTGQKHERQRYTAWAACFYTLLNSSTKKSRADL